VRLLLDTGVLGQICHPRRHQDVRSWFRRAVRDHTFLVSELADYELRRELLRLGAVRSLAHLDELGRELPYVPVLTAVWRRAAELWAEARNKGSVSADPHALDGDAIVSAKAVEEDAEVVTTNVRHFEVLGVHAIEWGAVPA
jgi:predicted nucleic acid-binding protein